MKEEAPTKSVDVTSLIPDIKSSTNPSETVEDKKPVSKVSENPLPKKFQFSGTWKKVGTIAKVHVAKEDDKAKPEISLGGLVAAKTIAKNARPATAGAAPTGNPLTALSMAKRKPIKPKMDLAKALSMMGFGTSRTLDPSGSKNARIELNAALTRKMNDFETKRRKLLETDKKVKYVSTTMQKQTADKLRDDIRTLHEAYQFLARKYIRDEEKLKEKMNPNAIDNDTLDLMDDLHLVNNFIEEEENGDNEVFNKKANNYMDNLRIKADRKKTM